MERLLDESLVHLLATDAHGVRNRPPLLAEGRQGAEHWVGQQEARRLVEDRPRGVMDNIDPKQLPLPPAREAFKWECGLRRRCASDKKRMPLSPPRQ